MKFFEEIPQTLDEIGLFISAFIADEFEDIPPAHPFEKSLLLLGYLMGATTAQVWIEQGNDVDRESDTMNRIMELRHWMQEAAREVGH